jgi:uncharacterized protein (TIRG00374 family)
MKLKVKIILGVLLEILLISLWLYVIDLEEALKYFKKVNIGLICIGMVCYVMAYFVRSIRWRLILAPIIRISVRKAFVLYTAGMFVNYLFPPLRAGELIKSIFLRKLNNIGISNTLPAVFVDKVIEAAPVILLFLLLLCLPYKPAVMVFIMVPSVILFVGLVVVLIFAVKNDKVTSRILKSWLVWLPDRLRSRMFNFIDGFLTGMKTLERHPVRLAALVIISAIAFVIDACYIFCFFKAFGMPIPFIIALVGYTLVTFSYIIPNPPCQIGSTEIVIVIIFSGIFGIDKNLVAAVDILAHILTGLYIISAGSTSLGMIGLKLKEVVKIEEEVVPKY